MTQFSFHPALWIFITRAAALLLLVTTVNLANAAEGRHSSVSIPSIANIAGVKVGYSSMEELEKRLGKGKVMIGGHPNGARLWRVKKTSWVIYADAFEYSPRGAVLDNFDVTVDAKPGQDVPFARLTKTELGWLGRVQIGMSEEELLQFLKQNSYAATKLHEGWLVKAKGFSPVTSDTLYPFQQWTAQFTITNKSLAQLHLSAQQRREDAK